MDNFSALLGKKLAGSGGGSGTSNYNELENKPQINGNTLSGNKTAANLGLQPAINQNNKLDADLLDDSESEKKLVSENDISNWNNKYDSDDAYTKAQTDTAIETAIAALDVTETGGSGKYISAISETDGIIAATAETMDTTPTANSTVPVTSGGVATDQTRQEVEIGAVANRGAKNLFKNTAVSKTYLGVKFTVNEDGTVSLSGAATTAAGVLEIGTVTLPAGSYIVSGCPEGGSWAPNPNKYRIRVAKNGAWLCDETGTGYTVTVNDSDVISLQVNSGIGVDTTGLVFKPMIRPASITDPTFQPYALPNPTLTPAVIKAVDEGAKNFLTENTKTETGQWTNIPVVLQAGSYVLAIGTLSSTDTDATTCQLGLFNSENQNLLGSYPQLNRGNNIVYSFEITSESSYLRVYSSDTTAHGAGDTVTVTNAMICTAADWAVSQKFVPYCPTNRELYEMIQALQSGTRSLSAPSESLTKGVIDTTAEEETEAMKSEVEKTEQEAGPEIEEKEGAEER